MNVHIIRGRLTRDPEAVGQNGNVAKFSVAVDDWDSAKQEKTAQFFNCVAFNKQAETVMKYLSKGRDVTIRGKQRQRSFENKAGDQVKVWELIVDELELGPRPQSHEDATDDSSAEVAGVGNLFD